MLYIIKVKPQIMKERFINKGVEKEKDKYHLISLTCGKWTGKQ